MTGRYNTGYGNIKDLPIKQLPSQAPHKV